MYGHLDLELCPGVSNQDLPRCLQPGVTEISNQVSEIKKRPAAAPAAHRVKKRPAAAPSSSSGREYGHLDASDESTATPALEDKETQTEISNHVSEIKKRPCDSLKKPVTRTQRTAKVDVNNPYLWYPCKERAWYGKARGGV